MDLPLSVLVMFPLLAAIAPILAAAAAAVALFAAAVAAGVARFARLAVGLRGGRGRSAARP